MKDQALYLEADEDITSAIDKLTKATGETVQIVVPKRSTLLQSIINLKLLKKAAGDQHKELVLVTSDKVASDLAARLGLAVAPALGAAAVVGDVAPLPKPATEDIIEADEPDPISVTPEPVAVAKPAPKKSPLFARKPVAEATVAATAAEAAAVADSEPAADAAAIKPHAKVPNFGRLQRRLAWFGVAAVLIVGFFLYINLASKATVTLYAAGTKVPVNLAFAVDPNQTSSSSGVLAGQTVTYTKDLSQAVTPTGTQDAGTKSNGDITISNCLDPDTHKFVAGTRFQAPDGKIFRSTADVTVPGGSGGFTGCTVPGKATVAVTADANGDAYNEAPSSYTIPGLPASQQTGQNSIKAQGSQMSGGTTKTVTVLSQDDVDKAETALLTADKDGSQKTLDAKVPSGYTVLAGSTAVTATNVTATPAVNTVATGGNVSVHVTYTELAVKKSDFQTMVRGRELAQIGSKSQIYDDGISAATISASGKDASGRPQFSLSTEAYSGMKIDTVELAKQMAGHKIGDANDVAARQPGVQRVTTILSPSWLPSLPSRATKIAINIQVASEN